MATNKLMIEIGAKDMASKVFKNLSASTVAFGVALGNLASKAITAGINGLRSWVDEALEAEKANVMLDASLRGIGQYTPQLAQQYRDLANAIQDETGASDEAGKANIALLASMGVMPENMAAAARGIQALTSLNVEGSMAAKAMARALEGDMAGFDRLSVKVRLATTDQEKAVEIGKFLQAGYEQQKATLQTVGGAWSALKGRIGDAREDILGAIFEGLQLGKTFDGMQSSIGAFLKSDTFKNFTNRLREGAAFAKDIFAAISNGGFKETAAGFGSIILAALKDGAEYIGVKISNAFSGAKSMFGETRVKIATMAGTPEAEARSVVYGNQSKYEGGNLKKAMDAWVDVVHKNAANVADTVTKTEEIAKVTETVSIAETLIAAQKQKALELLQDDNSERMIQGNHEERITQLDAEIERAKKLEAEASQNAARNANAAKTNAKMGLSEWIANAAKNNADEQAFNKSEAKQRRYIARLEEKQARGITLSREDDAALKAAKRKERQVGALVNADELWKKEATDFQKQQGKWEDEKIRLQKLMESHLDSMSKDLKETLRDQG